MESGTAADVLEGSVKFCSKCGHEGNDVVCPVCGEKMQSLDDEISRVAEIEKEEDVTESADDTISLDEVAKEEEKQQE